MVSLHSHSQTGDWRAGGLEGAPSLDIFAKAMRTNTEYFLHYEGDQAGSMGWYGGGGVVGLR